MIRHFAAGLSALAAIGGAAVAIPATAHAATGTIIINGKVFANPSGCYNSYRQQLTIQNNTNAPVTIYRGRGCTGMVTAVVRTGHSQASVGLSVRVP